MSFIVDNKEYRNIQEQVQKNKEDIADIMREEKILNAFGIKVIGVAATEQDIPEGEYSYGDTYAVGEEAPYSLYVWTRGNSEIPEDHFLNLGPIAIQGPQGIQGPRGLQGPQGPQGRSWNVGQGAPLTLALNDLYLDSLNGNVYVGTGNNQYQYLLNIKGPQGLQGVTGATGAQGPAGPQGPQGPKGDTGAVYSIVGTVTTTDDLPDPTLLTLHDGYLVGANYPYHLYGVIKNNNVQQWIDLGIFLDADDVPSYIQISATTTGTLSSEELNLLANDNVWLKRGTNPYILYRKIGNGSDYYYYQSNSTKIVENVNYNIIQVSKATGQWSTDVNNNNYFKGTELEDSSSLISSIIMTLLVYILGDTLPKTIARAIPNRMSKILIYPTYILMIVLFPISYLFEQIVKLIQKIFKLETNEDFTQEDFENVVASSEEHGEIEEEQAEIIQSALDFSETHVKEVFTPKDKMFAINIDGITREKLNSILQETSYSRIPLYKGDFNNIIGVLLVKTYVSESLKDPKVPLRKLIQKPYFVSSKITLIDLFNGFKKHKTHIAIVKDKNDNVVGMVTMEDVLEQIVGDIWDETDVVEEEVKEISETVFELDGDMVISDFCELLGIDEESFETESDTIGGWCLEHFELYPLSGDHFHDDELCLSVTIMSIIDRRVEKILVIKDDKEENDLQ